MVACYVTSQCQLLTIVLLEKELGVISFIVDLPIHMHLISGNNLQCICTLIAMDIQLHGSLESLFTHFFVMVDKMVHNNPLFIIVLSKSCKLTQMQYIKCTLNLKIRKSTYFDILETMDKALDGISNNEKITSLNSNDELNFTKFAIWWAIN